MTGVLMGGEDGHVKDTDTQGGHHVTTEADTGTMQLEHQGCQPPSAATGH